MGKRAPTANNEIIEVRQNYEMGDFPTDVQEAAEGFEDQLPRYTSVAEADDDLWHSRALQCCQKTVDQFLASV